MNLKDFGLSIELEEPNIWDVVTQDFTSYHGYHIPIWPKMISWSMPVKEMLFFECEYVRGMVD